MSAEEISYLKKEIDRQNQIITIILEQNALLKRENSNLRNVIGNQQNADSYAQTGVRLQHDTDSQHKTDVGINLDANSHEKTEVGNRINANSYAENEVWFQHDANSQHKTEVGIPINTNPYAKTVMGNTTTPKPLPQTLAIDEIAIRRVTRKLKDAGFTNVKRTGKRNIAKILLHFYNKGKGGYAELHKVTGLSKGGVGKLMMSLQKRGTIHRTSYQHYALSAGALQVLQKAYQD